MSEMKFTPGPWVLDVRSGCVAVYAGEPRICLSGGGGWAIHYSDKGAHYNGTHWDMDAQAVADASLIAAAPEMLEALQDMLAEASGNQKSCGHDFTCVCAGDKARAAIRKATGGAQ